MSARIRWFVALAVPLAFSSAIPVPAQQAGTTPGLIVGRVVDQASRRPISGASVAIGDSIVRAITDEQGRFAIDGIPPGPLRLTFSMIGYTSRTDTMTVRSGATQDLEVTLGQQTIQLDPIAVSVRSGWLQSSGFYEREQSNQGGTFITKDDVERRQPRQLTDLLREVPGLRMVYIDGGRIHARFNRESGNDLLAFEQSDQSLPGCEPDLYLDGILYREQAASGNQPRVGSFDIIDVNLVEGVEAYSGPNSPLQYQSTCGVILVWTSRGRSLSTSAPASRGPSAGPAASGLTMPPVEAGTLIRVVPRFGERVTGQVALVDADSLVLASGSAQSTYTIMNVRSLERDGGFASPVDRIRRGGKWGFLLSVVGVALTAAVEEFQALADSHETIPDNSVRRPAFAMKVITAGTLAGAFLGGSVWRYRRWVNVPLR